MKTEAEIMLQQATELQGLPANHWRLGRNEEGPSPTDFRGSMALQMS